MANDLQAVTGGQSSGKLGWLFCVLVFIAPFVIPRQFYDFSVVSKEAVIQVGTMATLTIWMLTGRRVKMPAVLPYILIFLAYVWATLLWAVNPFEGFTTALHWSTCSLAILIVFNIVNKDHLFLTIFASGFLVAVVGLSQHYAGFDYFQQVTPPGSTFANRNFAAHYVAACLPFGAYFYRRPSVLIPISAMIAYILTCRTRAAILAVIVALCFGVAVCLVRRRHMKLIAVAAVLAALSLIVFGNWVFVKGMDGTSGKIKRWEYTASMATDNPTGVGIGNFKVVFPAYDKTAKVERNAHFAHSEYLQLWAEAGFVGVILLTLAFVGTIMAVDYNNERWPFAVAAIICICAVSAFSFPMRLPNVPLVGACVLGAVSR